MAINVFLLNWIVSRSGNCMRGNIVGIIYDCPLNRSSIGIMDHSFVRSVLSKSVKTLMMPMVALTTIVPLANTMKGSFSTDNILPKVPNMPIIANIIIDRKITRLIKAFTGKSSILFARFNIAPRFMISIIIMTVNTLQ